MKLEGSVEFLGGSVFGGSWRDLWSSWEGLTKGKIRCCSY